MARTPYSGGFLPPSTDLAVGPARLRTCSSVTGSPLEDYAGALDRLKRGLGRKIQVIP